MRPALLAGLLLLPAPAAAQRQAETLRYHWSLRGLLGRVAGLVLPGEGRGELRRSPEAGGTVTELEITSPQGGDGEFYLYGSRTDAAGETQEAWTSYRYRNKEKSRWEEVEQGDVVDIAAGIQRIRHQRPKGSLRLRIWSDGKVYPVVVRRVGEESITVPAGTYATTHYKVQGVQLPGERLWKGGLDLWLADDAAATPVQIKVERGWANVRLELVPNGEGGSGSGGGAARRPGRG
ncbi:MAG TPA: DUF3108 domain-containing protein [Thermoanaerobaculia bacterium]|nr:DUF3108 domain-containing protein [Thermoanaerobaculia bacterium]